MSDLGKVFDRSSRASTSFISLGDRQVEIYPGLSFPTSMI